MTRAHGGRFDLIHRETALRADVYLAGDDPLHARAFERRQRIPAEQTTIWVAPVEYVVIRKLQYFRSSRSERHLRDVAMILRISADELDPEALRDWTARLDLQDALTGARGHDFS